MFEGSDLGLLVPGGLDSGTFDAVGVSRVLWKEQVCI